jgi:hypothetical protein
MPTKGTRGASWGWSTMTTGSRRCSAAATRGSAVGGGVDDERADERLAHEPRCLLLLGRQRHDQQAGPAVAQASARPSRNCSAASSAKANSRSR